MKRKSRKQLSDENKSLWQTAELVSGLISENEVLRYENENLRRENTELADENQSLRLDRAERKWERAA